MEKKDIVIGLLSILYIIYLLSSFVTKNENRRLLYEMCSCVFLASIWIIIALI